MVEYESRSYSIFSYEDLWPPSQILSDMQTFL